MYSKKLYCYTAKHKLREARYFFNRIQVSEIWNNDRSFDFHLNAFINSADMVIDYIHSDFLFHKIKDPRIKWQKWEKIRINNKAKKEFISKHPNKKAIEEFLRFFLDEREKLFRIPLVNYFHYKRNEIAHNRWSSASFGAFEKKPKMKTQFTERKFEGSYKLFLIEKHGDDVQLDMFDDRISRKKQIDTLKILCSKDVRLVCKGYLSELSKFIKKFDGKNFFR